MNTLSQVLGVVVSVVAVVWYLWYADDVKLKDEL
jgi:hypothetical protein